ncbi:hypothetical protein CUTA107171_09010 [Cupriavidus taiwanensis]
MSESNTLSETPTWSYEEVTAVTEDSIRFLLEKSDKDIGMGRRDEWVAYGLYLGWSKLTAGRRKPEDDKRLHELTRRFRDAGE